MPYFRGTDNSFENAISRGAFSMRSPMLKQVVSDVQLYCASPSLGHFLTLINRLAGWKIKHPKEYADRGAPLEGSMLPELVNECRRWNIDLKDPVFQRLRDYLAVVPGGKPAKAGKPVVYSPFSKFEATDPRTEKVFRLLGTSFEQEAVKDRFEVRRHPDPFGRNQRPLSDLHAERVLYIVAHCAAGLNVIQDNIGNQIDATELVARLNADGLPKSHRVIKLWACSGGADSPKGDRAFAKTFLKALRDGGYADAIVYGYLKTVTSVDSGDGHHRYAIDDQTGHRVRAHEERVAFID